MDSNQHIPEAEATRIREFVFAGRKIQAIKVLREVSGLGLKEAKDVVESLEKELRETSPEKFTGPKGGGCAVRVSVFLLGLIIVLMATQVFAASRARDFLKETDAWFADDEGLRIASNVMSWQSDAGDWPKNTDTATVAYHGERSKLHGTFDNGATCDEIRFLGRAYGATHQMRFRSAAVVGIEHILRAQYENGGWPQSFPPGNGYARYITFNDNTVVHLMALMREVGREDRWRFVFEQQKRASEAFERGVGCILKCQIRDRNGKLTVWCAQHDEKTFEPRGARAYELPSFSGSESVQIVRLLMSIEKPTPEIVASVEGAVAWLKNARIEAIKVVEVPDEKSPKGKDKRVVEDKNGPGLWARFYEIDTGRPFFCDRDGVKKYSLAEIGYERRNGYAWYGTWGEELIKNEYPLWVKRIDSKN